MEKWQYAVHHMAYALSQETDLMIFQKRPVINYFWQIGLLFNFLLNLGESVPSFYKPVALLQTTAKCEQIKTVLNG